MYLHLGEDVVVSFADVIGVFDLDNTSVSAITRDFLARAQKTPGMVINVSFGLPKSFILCQEKKRTGQALYLPDILRDFAQTGQ